MATYAIDILDKQNKKIGELMTANMSEILQLINKGFTIVDKATNQQITENMLLATVGVSECIIWYFFYLETHIITMTTIRRYA